MNTSNDMTLRDLLFIPFWRQLTTGANQALYVFGALYTAQSEWRALDGSFDAVGVTMFVLLALAFYLMIVTAVFVMTPVFTLLKQRFEAPAPAHTAAIPASRDTGAGPAA